MSKRKSYDSSKEDKEDVYGEIRRLRKIIKVKDREITRLEKYIHNGKGFESSPRSRDDQFADYAVAQRDNLDLPKPRCTECGSEDTEQWELNSPGGLKKYITCNKCGKRRLLNPKGVR